MNTEQHDYAFYRVLAERTRQGKVDQGENAIILIREREVQGWCTKRPNPQIESGLVAVHPNGRIFVARDGRWQEDDAQLELPLAGK